MKISMPSTGFLLAAGRHGITAIGTLALGAAAIHAMSPENAHALINELNEFSDGVSKAVAAVGAMMVTCASIYAGLKGSPLWQIFAVSQNPDVQAVIPKATDAGVALANASPPNVVPAGTTQAADLAKAA